jgi:RimJ/RimL family protein N-acetyltransferase
VAKEYRSQGLFDLLYQQHRAFFQHKYDFVLTEIATRNTRSMRAHQRVGFQQLALLRDSLDEWSVVTWDWQQV